MELRLIAAGADMEADDALGARPLDWAAKAGHAAVVQQLLLQRADISPRIELPTAPVGLEQIVIRSGSLWSRDRFARFVSTRAGGIIQAVPASDAASTAYHVAAAEGHVSVARALQRSRADSTVCDSEGATPLHWAATRCQQLCAGPKVTQKCIYL